MNNTETLNAITALIPQYMRKRIRKTEVGEEGLEHTYYEVDGANIYHSVEHNKTLLYLLGCEFDLRLNLEEAKKLLETGVLEVEEDDKPVTYELRPPYMAVQGEVVFDGWMAQDANRSTPFFYSNEPRLTTNSDGFPEWNGNLQFLSNLNLLPAGTKRKVKIIFED